MYPVAVTQYADWGSKKSTLCACAREGGVVLMLTFRHFYGLIERNKPQPHMHSPIVFIKLNWQLFFFDFIIIAYPQFGVCYLIQTNAACCLVLRDSFFFAFFS
jgi:hypothetical protein